MVKAVRIHSQGGVDVLRYEDIETGRPGKGEARIRHTAIGLNFLDVYYRNGVYAPPAGLPLTLGNEAAGVVSETGEGVSEVKTGDRVAYVGSLGAYAEERLIAADRLVKLPDNISDEQAAGIMMKGMTAEYLLRRTYPVKPGDTVLYHAAAGGVGLLFGQWAKHLGATVIGTASSADKIALAKAHGFDHVINYRETDFLAAVKEITGGRMCDVVYDSVGKDTFPASLDCLKPRSLFVSFGQASGPIPPFNMAILSQKGSLYATRPTIFSYIAKRDELEASAAALFDVVGKGIVKVEISERYPLGEAGRAHADLEGRRTTGTHVLIP
jgi:NADPH2:quinone reductase